MNYTNHYRLPQWEKTDRVLMDDFNQAMTSIESGIDAARDEARRKEDALAKADAELSARIHSAQASADAALAALPYVTGSFTGTDQEQKITLGFRPSFLIISGMEENPDHNSSGYVAHFTGITAGKNKLGGVVRFEDDGFTVIKPNGNLYPVFIDRGRVHDFIAFR